MKSIAKALQQEQLSADMLAGFIQQACTRKKEVAARLSAIRPIGKHRSPAGPVRHQALLSGEVEEVRKLDAEHADLEIEAEQLQAQISELQARRQRARVREAVDGMPQRYTVLAERLNAVSAARDLLLEALRGADAAFGEIEQARFNANGGGATVPPSDAALLEQVRALQPVAALAQTRLWARSAAVEDALGVKYPKGSSAA